MSWTQRRGCAVGRPVRALRRARHRRVPDRPALRATGARSRARRLPPAGVGVQARRLHATSGAWSGPARGAAQPATVEYYDARARTWKRVRTVTVERSEPVRLPAHAGARQVLPHRLGRRGSAARPRRSSALGREVVVRARLARVDLEPHVGRSLVGAPASVSSSTRCRPQPPTRDRSPSRSTGVKPTPWSTISVRMRSGSFVISSRTGPSPPYLTPFVISSDTSSVMSGRTCSGRLGSSWSARLWLVPARRAFSAARGCTSWPSLELYPTVASYPHPGIPL